METLFRDIRYGARSLMKRPGFTTVALIALALGIGANTAIFSLVNAVLLRPLPFAEPDRLVWAWGNVRTGSNRASVSPPDFLDYRQQNTAFEEFAAFMPVALNLTGAMMDASLCTSRPRARSWPLALRGALRSAPAHRDHCSGPTW